MYRPILAIALALLLDACHSPSAAQSADTPESAGPPMPGSDRDAHGCIGSAGYSWCEKTARCERPQELAKAQNFTLSQASFETYCGPSEP